MDSPSPSNMTDLQQDLNDTIPFDTIPTQPLDPDKSQAPMAPMSGYTQPTQLLNTPPRASQSHSPPIAQSPHNQPITSSPSVRVAASSPFQPQRSPYAPSTRPIAQGAFNNGVLQNRMVAPPGTTAQYHTATRNYPTQASQSSQASQWPGKNMTQQSQQDNVRVSDSSDDEHSDDIKPQTFTRNGTGINLGQYTYNQQRSADAMASAYGPRERAPLVRQPGVSRAQPVGQAPQPVPLPANLYQIEDWRIRGVIASMKDKFPQIAISQLYAIFVFQCKLNQSDAEERVIQIMERKAANTVDLTSSPDPLSRNMSPGFAHPNQPMSSKQTVQNSTSMGQKYNTSMGQRYNAPQYRSQPQLSQDQMMANAHMRMQQLGYHPSQMQRMPRPLQPGIHHSAQYTPQYYQRQPQPYLYQSPPQVSKVRRVNRPKRSESPESSSPVAAAAPRPSRAAARGRKRIVDSDDEEEEEEELDDDDEDSGIEADPVPVLDYRLEAKALNFLNTAAVSDIVETCSTNKDIALKMIESRPFTSLDDARDVNSSNSTTTKTGKTKVTTRNIGEKLVDKCCDMFLGYQAVDTLVSTCASISRPIAPGMKRLGFSDPSGKYLGGELEATEIDVSHDSGLGTPSSSTSDEEKPFMQPKNMNSEMKMKNYQIVGMNWLSLLHSHKLSCILADDMGLGKTCQIIAFFAHLLETGVKGPHLVVVPGSTVENWMREFQMFCPALEVFIYYGKQDEREGQKLDIQANIETINVVVTTYDMAFKKEDCSFLRSLRPDVCVYDEGHYLRNASSQRYQSLMRITANQRILLTGTPLQNNLQELVALLSFLMPNVFSQHQEALQLIFKHRAKTTDEDHTALLADERVLRARSMMTPFVLRRKKAQVLQHLPEKTSVVEYVELTDLQKQIYAKVSSEARKVLVDPYADDAKRQLAKEKGAVESKNANIIMKLRQAALHPLLLRRRYTDELVEKIASIYLRAERKDQPKLNTVVDALKGMNDYQISRFCLNEDPPALRKYSLPGEPWMHAAKITTLVAQLRKNMAAGARTLIFSQFVTVMDILELVFSTEQIRFYRLDGSTKMNERQDLLDAFYADDTPVFMLSTKAGGAGINLACANKVIIFDSSFNPQDDIQAENRAHRVGQTRPVEVMRFVTRNTIEEQIYALGQSKLALDDKVAGLEDAVEARGKQAVEKMIRDKLDSATEDTAVKIEEEEEPLDIQSSDDEDGPMAFKPDSSPIENGGSNKKRSRGRATPRKTAIAAPEDDLNASQVSNTSNRSMRKRKATKSLAESDDDEEGGGASASADLDLDGDETGGTSTPAKKLRGSARSSPATSQTRAGKSTADGKKKKGLTVTLKNKKAGTRDIRDLFGEGLKKAGLDVDVDGGDRDGDGDTAGESGKSAVKTTRSGRASRRA